MKTSETYKPEGSVHTVALDDNLLAVVRDTMAAKLNKDIEQEKKDAAVEDLAIINQIQQALHCQQFESLEQYSRNVSDTWEEIVTQ